MPAPDAGEVPWLPVPEEPALTASAIRAAGRTGSGAVVTALETTPTPVQLTRVATEVATIHAPAVSIETRRMS
jgi:hypothetical protein